MQTGEATFYVKCRTGSKPGDGPRVRVPNHCALLCLCESRSPAFLAFPRDPSASPAPFPIPLEEALDWEKGCLGSGSGFMKNWLKDSGWLWQPASVI